MGAGLLAKAVCQWTKMLPDTAPSRASSLPQGSWRGTRGQGTPQIHCGSEPAREEAGTSSRIVSDRPLSRASSFPQKFVVNTDSMNTRDQCGSRACSRWRRYVQLQCRLTHRCREQAQLPQELAVNDSALPRPRIHQIHRPLSRQRHQQIIHRTTRHRLPCLVGGRAHVRRCHHVVHLQQR